MMGNKAPPRRGTENTVIENRDVGRREAEDIPKCPRFLRKSPSQGQGDIPHVTQGHNGAIAHPSHHSQGLWRHDYNTLK